MSDDIVCFKEFENRAELETFLGLWGENGDKKALSTMLDSFSSYDVDEETMHSILRDYDIDDLFWVEANTWNADDDLILATFDETGYIRVDCYGLIYDEDEECKPTMTSSAATDG